MNNDRKYIVQGFIIVIALVFLCRLFYLQIINEDLKEKAALRTVKSVTIYPGRGTIYDRNGGLIVTNTPVYDLTFTNKIAKRHPIQDTMKFCDLLGITKQEFIDLIAYTTDRSKNKSYSTYTPQVLISQIPETEYHSIVDKFHYKGYEFVPRTIRKYPHKTLAHTLGYISMVDDRDLSRDGFYRKNDFIGKIGVEKYYEKYLRGEKGVRKFIKNERGIENKSFKKGKYDTSAIAGASLISTIDIDLQLYAEKLLKGKRGSVVAIEPSTGEILAIVSAPNYDPNLLTGRDFSKNYTKIQSSPGKLLVDKSVTAGYSPGSTFKTICGLIGLQEKVITTTSTMYCDNSIIGDHAPPGYYNLHNAIRLSSNNYFCKLLFRTIQQGVKKDWHEDSKYGLARWRDYMHSFGIGKKLGSDIYHEGSGGRLLDSASIQRDYRRRYNTEHYWRWNSQSIKSIGIGQGEVRLTPLHMANMTAAIANKGYYITPHVIKGIKESSHHEGELFEFKKYQTLVDSSYFQYVIDAMEAVVKNGTASAAYIDSLVICGKTGTIENGLKKDKKRDHSAFISLAPKENPQIVIAAYVENSGYGGTWAAPICRLMIEKYLTGKLTPMGKFYEKRVLEFKLR